MHKSHIVVQSAKRVKKKKTKQKTKYKKEES